MTQVTLTNGINFADLSAADLAKLLAAARKAEKENKEKLSALPSFSFLAIMTDGTQSVWTGKAADYDSALTTATETINAKEEGVTIWKDNAGHLAIMPRPVPGPRGRKAKAKDADAE